MMPFRHPYSSVKVLHIDDDQLQIEMVKQFVGYFDKEIEIDSTTDVKEFKEKLCSNYYDCLIVDFQMPEITGIELAKSIRKTNDIPIIIYTGQGSEEVAAEAYKVGITDYIRKEITPPHYQILAKRIRDIVEKRRIEHIYSNIVKDAKDAIALIAQDKLFFANKTFLNLLGSTEKELYMEDNLKIVKNLKKKLIDEDIQKLLSGEKKSYTAEVELKKRNNEKIPVEVKISAINYLGGKVLLFIIRDITERKILENEIKRSETKYRALIELAPDGVITLSLTGTVTWVNDAYTTITGYTADEIVGKKAWSLKTVKPTDITIFFKAFFDTLRGKDVPSMQFQWIAKDGTMGWGEGRASLIKIGGDKKEVLLSLRDITERKQMEDDLLTYSKEMQRLAEERAEKLIQSEKMILAGTIASSVAHDMKGPLNTILNAVYLMDIKPEKATEMKKIIVKAVENASNMLEEARNKTISTQLNYEEIDIADLIGNVIAETPRPSYVQIRTNLKHINVEIDKLKMRRVFENLLRNSVEAIESKGCITFTNMRDNESVLIEVEDTGIGIEKSRLDNLFKPFQTTKATGTGLGLTYIKKTIDEHGGLINVKSKIGVGTTFTLRIPIKKVTNAKEAIAHSQAISK